MISRLMELLAPAECVGCGMSGDVLCHDCAARVGPPKAGVCFRCNRLSAGGRTCEQCRRYTVLRGVAVGSYYDGAVKELVLALKFRRQRAAAEVAAGLILAAFDGRTAVEVVTDVPVAAARYRERGYNQSELVARQVARGLKLPYTRLLGRRDGAHQLGSGRQTRLEQVAGAFYSVRRADNLRVLVVDDVITTGATLGECARALASVGADSVWGAAVARH